MMVVGTPLDDGEGVVCGGVDEGIPDVVITAVLVLLGDEGRHSAIKTIACQHSPGILDRVMEHIIVSLSSPFGS